MKLTVLQGMGAAVESKNNGLHFVVHYNDHSASIWPSGKWQLHGHNNPVHTTGADGLAEALRNMPRRPEPKGSDLRRLRRALDAYDRRLVRDGLAAHPGVLRQLLSELRDVCAVAGVDLKEMLE